MSTLPKLENYRLSYEYIPEPKTAKSNSNNKSSQNKANAFSRNVLENISLSR